MTGVWLACGAPYGAGGLGQHFAQLVEDARRAGELGGYFCHRPKPGDEGLAVEITSTLPDWLGRWTPVRLSPGWRSFVAGEHFDRATAGVMSAVPETYVGFVGQALHSFRRARRLGTMRLELMAANSHVLNVRRQHQRAIERYGIEASWLNAAQIRKTLKEYRMADIIHAASAYTVSSFVKQGVPVRKLRRRRFEVHPRYRPPESRPNDGIFRIVYVGSLTVMKGIPVLLEAFAKLPIAAAELTLVGGWATRGMRRYVQAWVRRDHRIRVAPGDPLPHFQRADVCVHPSFEDGFGYAPAEALACGMPVIVTEDTGMKELVREGDNGFVVPTGDTGAIIDRLLGVCRAKSA